MEGIYKLTIFTSVTKNLGLSTNKANGDEMTKCLPHGSQQNMCVQVGELFACLGRRNRCVNVERQSRILSEKE